MKTLDDAWNSQDWETFKKRHAENTAVFWPDQPDPTKGRKAHYDECAEFFKTFPDNHLVNNPYKIMFGQGDIVEDPWGNTRIAFTGIAKISRKDFGLTTELMRETGGLLVGKDITINIAIEAIPISNT